MWQNLRNFKAFVEKAGETLLVVDVRNPNADQEPGDQTSLAVAGLPCDTFRPQAIHLIYNRSTESMPLPDVPLDTPIITHCGGGGRGQKAKDYLETNGFTTCIKWWRTQGNGLLGMYLEKSNFYVILLQ